MKNKEKVFFTVGLALFSVVLLVDSFSYHSYKQQLLPLLVGLIVLVLLIVELLTDLEVPFFLRLEKRIHNDIVDMKIEGLTDRDRNQKDGTGEQTAARAQWRIFAWLIALGLGGYLLGWLYIIPVFLLPFFRLDVKQSWFASVALTAGVFAFIYLLFVVVLQVRFYG